MTENRESAKTLNKFFLYLIGQDPASLATQALIRKQIALEQQCKQHEENLAFLEKKGKSLKQQAQEYPEGPSYTLESGLKQWKKDYQFEQEKDIPEAENFEGDTEAPESENPEEEQLYQSKIIPLNPEFSRRQTTRPLLEPDHQSTNLRNARSQLHTEELAA